MAFLAAAISEDGERPPGPFRALWRRLFGSKSPSPQNIVVVGLHGWIPTRLLQRVIGQPLVTSALLVESLTRALLDAHPSCRIHQYPLEAEGSVKERLETHLRQIQDLQGLKALLKASSTRVFVIAHSQGVPIAGMLVESLFEVGILKSYSQVRLVGLMGVLEGPYRPIRQHPAVKYYEGFPAKELFHFGRKDKEVKRDVDRALSKMLSSGGIVLLTAGWFDPVVPLDSALLCSFGAHPNLRRFVFIPDNLETDARPLVAMIKLCLELLSEPTHAELGSRLLTAISGELVPSLYVGTGHSDAAVSMEFYQSMAFQTLNSSGKQRIMPTIFTADRMDDKYSMTWLLNDVSRIQDSAIRALVASLKDSLALWNPKQPIWRKFRPAMVPLLSSKL